MALQEDTDFIIRLGRLHGGVVQVIKGEALPKFLDIDETEVTASAPVCFFGEAYIAEDDLIVTFSAETAVTIPCSICNSLVEVALTVKNSYHAVPLKDLRDVYDVSVAIREELVLEIPQFAECCDGHCPQREAAVAYICEAGSDKDERYRPFADLDLDV